MAFVIKRLKRSIDGDEHKNDVIKNISRLRTISKAQNNNINVSKGTIILALSGSRELPSLSTDIRDVKRDTEPVRSNDVNLQEIFPPRPGFGYSGKRIKILSNFFEMEIDQSCLYHYHVDIIPVKKNKEQSVSCKRYNCLNTRENRKVIDNLLSNFQIFRNYPVAFDGKKNLFSCNLMPIEEEKTFFVSLKSNNRTCDYNVVLKPVCKDKMVVPRIDLRPFRGKSLKNFEEAVMAVDTIMRHGPAKSLVPIGRSFFSSSSDKERISVGAGREIWFGYHQSVRIAQWKPMLNVDISATAFYKSGPLIKFVEEVLNADVKQCRGLDDRQIKTLQKELKSLKITVNHLQYKKTYKINSVTSKPARYVCFIWQREDAPCQISVADYFKRQYGELRYPHLPCVCVGNTRKCSYLPLEVCEVCPGQHCSKKMDEKQEAEMIRNTARPPQVRFKDITKAVKQTCQENQELNRKFRIQVNSQPVRVDGRVLMPPMVMYSKLEEILPQNGAWDLRDKSFYRPVDVVWWAFVSMSSNICKEADMLNFVRMMCQGGRKFGMIINKPCYLREYSSTNDSVDCLLKNIISSCPRIQLIMIVLPSRGRGSLYAEIKQMAEIRMGLITQCVKDVNILGKRCNSQLICNLCQKINAKLGGINNILSPMVVPNIFHKPVIVIGADCTHPSPHDKIKSSIAALVGSLDNYPSRYAATVSVQTNGKKNRMEIIENMKAMMKDLLVSFYRNTGGKKPEKIIFYRDGLSEGEFSKAVNKELMLMRDACAEMNPSEVYQPPITFVVVGKRHHTRFVPENLEDGVGKHRNIPPGTTVDTTIVHPTQFDFYICSHTGNQGTSRPAHYTVLWDDNNFTADELQTLSYYLCHTYVRCTRSISIPCPVMYAHLAAYRAKQHLLARWENGGRNNDSNCSLDLSDEQLLENSFNRAVEVDRKIKNAMYFV
ncbi:protein argonaute-2-like [Centruroides sculpturatus]|uniref:protein argonaute-2-like n=1 Tax=Centruroides sculpturatus TaxID=218467 RepID=UPI000C6E4924|nr:protein argonaute-2-like [Centruroides sculpturatus]